MESGPAGAAARPWQIAGNPQSRPVHLGPARQRVARGDGRVVGQSGGIAEGDDPGVVHHDEVEHGAEKDRIGRTLLQGSGTAAPVEAAPVMLASAAVQARMSA